MSIHLPASEPVRADAAPAGAPACPSCAAVLAGEYCHRCGERNPAAEDRSLRRFFREAASEVGDLDSKLMRTYRALLTAPGFLTLEYLAGRRKGYLGPLKTFLIIFAAMLFSAVLVERYTPAGQAPDGATGGFVEQQAEQVVGTIAERRNVSRAEAKRELMEAIQKRLSWFSVLVPLLFGVVAHAAFRRRRRWFAENLVFATHFAAYNYLFGLILLPAQVVLPRFGAMWVSVLSLVLFGVMTVYMARAVRRVYPGSRWGGIPGSFALLLGFSVCQGIVSLLAIGSAVLTLTYL